MADPLNEIRRDIAKLGTDLARGMGAAHLMIETAQKQISDLGTRLEGKIKEDHRNEVVRAGELGQLKAQLDSMDETLKKLAGLPEKFARLEANHEHIKDDVTGRHEIAKVHAESAEKKEERELEKKKIAADERKAKLQFWGAIAAVSLPGIISMVWQIFGFAGSPPTPPAAHPELPSVAAPPHSEEP